VTAIVRLHLPRHRASLEAHFAAHSSEDLRLRFCCSIGPEFVANYLDRLQTTSVPSYGIFNPGLELIAVGQFSEIDQPGHDLEAGLSVLEPYRRQGLAAALLCRAASYGRSRGLKAMVIHCLAGNTPMLSLARRLGMTIEMSRGEADGRLKLRAGTGFDFWSEIAYDHAGIADSVAKAWQLAVQSALAPASFSSPRHLLCQAKRSRIHIRIS
jgi:RimJ/RimL family protein N-acetyltransferase